MVPRILIAFCLLAGACATAQPVTQPTVATIGAKGAVVDTIDARNVHDETAGARFEIPPGLHTVEVSLPADPNAKTDDVKVIYLKQPNVDLTPRVKAFVQPTGIDMPDAQLPPGDHLVRIDVKDSEGRVSTTSFVLKIAP